jgi:hypothetical protein
MRRMTRGACAGGLIAVLSVLGLTGAAPTTDSWDALYLAGSKVGHVHTWVEQVTDRGRDLLRVRFNMKLNVKRLNDTSTIELEWGTIETPEGTVLRLDTVTTASDQKIRVHGDVIDGKLKLSMDGTGQHQEQVLDWGPDVRGPYAPEQSLSRQPLKPGEVRELKMFMPDLNRICDVSLKALDEEEVTLGGGVKRTLLKVAHTLKIDGKKRPEFDTDMWVDSGGQILKTRTENNGVMVTYRTTREGALAPDNPAGAFDQITQSVIKLKRKIPRPDATRDVSYRITLKNDEPAEVIPTDRRQSVTPGANKNEVVLRVKTAGPGDGAPEGEAADPVFLRANAMITSEDKLVVSQARRAVGSATDPWEKAKKIERWVHQNLKDKNFGVTFASASEVARNLSGDCTEHGVLVAAMCRAQGVPARVAVGLVYAENLGGFGYHLWNEVYVNRRWVAIDATFDEEAVDAVHIKLSDASLDGVSPFETFLPIVRVLGKMTIDTIEIR